MPSPDPTGCRCGPRSPARVRTSRTVAEFTVWEGQQIPFSLTWFPASEDPPRPVDAAYAIQDTELWWTDWASQCTYEGEYREAVVRSLITLKALTYEPTGRHRGRRHHLAARDAGGQPELGLSVLLAARRHPHPRVADAGWLLPGGHGLAELAAAGHRRRSLPDADHVRGGGRAPARRMGDRLAPRLPEFGAGAHRQRRRRSVPAGRLRRGDVGAVRVGGTPPTPVPAGTTRRGSSSSR